MSTENHTTAKPAFELLDNGDVVQNRKGKATILAHYDDVEGRVEFESADADEKYRAQIIRAITEDTEGNLNQNVIVTYAIKGREVDEIKKNEPPMPKATKRFGDKTPAVVEWYFKWRPQEAYARFGVLLDKDGQPVTAHCRRIERTIEENPNTGLVEQVEHVIESQNGIIARRATHMTFLAEEKVGNRRSTEEETD